VSAPTPRPDRRPTTAIDPDLVDVLAAQVDRAAFATLYRRYLDRVYGYAFYQLGDHHDADIACQGLWQKASTCAGP
jgi:DNA-directed RNA polymerase specialized sigma24 family protein